LKLQGKHCPPSPQREELEQHAPSVATTIIEGLDEYADPQLALPLKLRRSLACTTPSRT
jgi:hypothetical protein